MKTPFVVLCFAFAAACLCGQVESRKTLAVADVETASAVTEAAAKRGTENALKRLSQALASQLTDAFQQTGKFQLVARADLPALMKEQSFSASGNTAGGLDALKGLRGADYLLVVTLDDFQDRVELGNFELADTAIRRRSIRAQATAKIYDTAQGTLLATATATSDAFDVDRQFDNVALSDPNNDRLIAKSARALAQSVAEKTTQSIYPARVLAKSGAQVTVNRGEGVAQKGQIWVITAQGETLVDPDTKEVLGRQEIPVGKIRVTQVAPKYFIGEVVEDFGIEPLQVATPQS